MPGDWASALAELDGSSEASAGVAEAGAGVQSDVEVSEWVNALDELESYHSPCPSTPPAPPCMDWHNALYELDDSASSGGEASDMVSMEEIGDADALPLVEARMAQDIAVCSADRGHSAVTLYRHCQNTRSEHHTTLHYLIACLLVRRET